MQTIELRNALPAVFAGRDHVPSDVWEQNLTLERGKNYIVEAESGTGKSSLCAYLYGYRTDYSGMISFDGTDVQKFSVEQWCDIRRRHLAYLPQDLRLFPELTAMENVQLKNRLTEHHTVKEIEDMFATLGIAEKRDSLVGKMSIGQQQRVAIVRALCQPFDFILLDEPVSHLDAANNAVVARMVSDEAARQGAGIIATSVGNNVMMQFDKELKL